jgi:nucleoside 2-deoxyribosyltransferase
MREAIRPSVEGMRRAARLQRLTQGSRARRREIAVTIMKIYLAGPEVFLPDAKAIGKAKKSICDKHGIEGLYPLDNDVPPVEPKAAWANDIFEANRELMDRADGVIANMTPFRGLSMDAGTAFEMGYMCARNTLVLAYTNAGGTYLQRAREAGLVRPGDTVDALGLTVEDFDFNDNLMMACAVCGSGFEVIAEERRRLSGIELYSDLAMFERCVEAAAKKGPRRSRAVR